jgi:hypothetical protein
MGAKQVKSNSIGIKMTRGDVLFSNPFDQLPARYGSDGKLAAVVIAAGSPKTPVSVSYNNNVLRLGIIPVSFAPKP